MSANEGKPTGDRLSLSQGLDRVPMKLPWAILMSWAVPTDVCDNDYQPGVSRNRNHGDQGSPCAVSSHGGYREGRSDQFLR